MATAEIRTDQAAVVLTRADGTELSTDEVRDALADARVVSALLPGDRVGLPDVVLVTVAVHVDVYERVVTWDVTTGAGPAVGTLFRDLAQRLRASIVREEDLDDVVILADGTVLGPWSDGDCRYDEAWTSAHEENGVTVAHVYRGEIAVEAHLTAFAAGEPLPTEVVDGWTVVHVPPDAPVHGRLWGDDAEETPLFRLERVGVQVRLSARVRVGRRTATLYAVRGPAVVPVLAGLPDHLDSLFADRPAIVYSLSSGRAALPHDVRLAVVDALESDDPAWAALEALGVPRAVVDRLALGTAGRELTMVEPLRWRSAVAAEVGTEVRASTARIMAKYHDPARRRSRFRRPWMLLAGGLTEVAAGAALLLADLEPPGPGWVWTAGFVLLALDGASNVVQSWVSRRYLAGARGERR